MAKGKYSTVLEHLPSFTQDMDKVLKHSKRSKKCKNHKKYKERD